MGGKQIGHAIRALAPLALLLAACAGPPLPPLPVLPLAPTQSRLILFRPAAFIAEGRIPAIEVNGVESCMLKNGSAFAQDVPPGTVTITIRAAHDAFAPVWGFSKVDKTFTTAPGQTYYVKFRPNAGILFTPSALAEFASGAPTGAFYMSLSDAAEMGKLVPVGCGPGREYPPN